MYRRLAWLASLGSLLVAGCTGSGQPCETNRDCPDDHICRYDQCLETDWNDESPTRAPDVEPDGPRPDTDPAVGPRLEAPETVEFDDPGDEQTIEVTNTGDETLTIESHNLDREAFSLTSAQSPAELSPGETLAIGIRYDSTEPGTHEATLTLETAPDEVRTSIELVGQTDECLEVTPSDPLRFRLDSPDSRREKTVQATNCDDGPIVSVGAELRGEDADAFEFPFRGTETQLRPGEDIAAPVLFGPTEESGTFEAELVIETNLPNREQIVIDLVGSIDVDCPTPEIEPRLAATGRPISNGTTSPQSTIVLDASDSQPRDAIESYQWTALNAPPNAEPTFRPSNNEPSPEVRLDHVGVWSFELTLEGPAGWETCEPTTVEIEAVPNTDVYVELSWTTPGDANPDGDEGADLDLHYLHSNAGSWASEPWDIYWANQTAEWGQPGVVDNPELVADADHAPGPELLSHDRPENGTRYSVGVYYYDDNDLGASYANVRIFTNGELDRGWTDREIAETSDFWEVAQIEWPSANIDERDTMHEGYPEVQ